MSIEDQIQKQNYKEEEEEHQQQDINEGSAHSSGTEVQDFGKQCPLFESDHLINEESFVGDDVANCREAMLSINMPAKVDY
jgi:hypothetical protein